MPNVSIMVSAQDNFSTAIKSMSLTVKGFSKDAEEMQRKLDTLNKNKVSLKVDADKARQELRELEKQFAKTGDEADGLKMQFANENYENLRRNLNLVAKGAKDVEKAMISAGGASSKMENKAWSKGGMLETIAAAGAMAVGGDMLAGMSKTLVGSSFGSEASTMFSSMISGLGTGAAIGNAILPGGIGAAVGAGVGLAAGSMNGYAQNFEKKDDAFKGVVQSEYDRATQQQLTDLQAGTAIAAGREIDSIAFSKLYGSQSIGDAQLNWVKDTANSTPFLYEDLKALSKTLATYGFSPEDSQKRLMQIGDTGAALGMSTQDMAMVATGLGRMQSSDKASLEYLNLLVERGIPAIDYLAEAYDKSKGDIYDMISKSQIKGTDAAEVIANYMGAANVGAMDAQSKTFSGLSSTVEGMMQELQNAMGEGFVKERNAGLQKQIDWASGEQGAKMMAGNELIGQYKASLENDREQAVRDATDAAMATQEYKNAIAIASVEEQKRALVGATEMTEAERQASAEAGRILMEAQVKAENEYKKSEGYQLYLETEKSMLSNLRADLSIGWEDFGYSMSQQFTFGLTKGYLDRQKALTPEGGYSTDYLPNYLTGGNSGTPEKPYDGKYSYLTGGGYAFGLTRVPFDNFPAMLHQGERVLTASEARAADHGAGAPTVTITGNEFVVREEADIDRIAAKLAYQLQKASAVYAG